MQIMTAASTSLIANAYFQQQNLRNNKVHNACVCIPEQFANSFRNLRKEEQLYLSFLLAADWRDLFGFKKIVKMISKWRIKKAKGIIHLAGNGFKKRETVSENHG